MKSSLSMAAAAALLLSLAACSGGGGGDTVAAPAGKTFKITPGPTATDQMIAAMVTVVPGDTIEFDCGFFDLKTSLQLSNTEAITIKGCGRDKSVLSFKGSNQPVGILAVNVRGIVVQDLSVVDTAGNGFELRAVDHGTLERVRAFWSSGGGGQSATPIKAGDDYAKVMAIQCTGPATLNPNVPENSGRPETVSKDYTVSDKAGRYGIYPVSSDNIHIVDSESIGASDAGIYVGQSNTVIIEHSRAAYNVFGFEIENVRGGEYHDNVAECNVGGYLVYDLDGNLRQYGDRTRMYKNVSRMNNSYNFTHGGFVANVPPGSGMITLAYDRIDIFDNEFRDNNTAGIIHTSYQIFPEGAGRPTEKRIDFYSEGVHIWHNRFFNNGNALPDASTADMQNQDLARLLPALVGYKNQAACGIATNAATCQAAGTGGAGASPRAASGYRGAHIVWDGLEDTLDESCAYPVDANGNPVPADERGKPQFSNQENPTCHYNKYKFDLAKDGKPRITPDWTFACIDADNQYSDDSLHFANFHGTKGANAAIDASSGKPPTPEQAAELQDFPSSFDLSPHDCVAKFTKNLPPLPAVVIPPFVPSAPTDVTPSPEEVAQLCNAVVPAGQVNFAAAKVNCPTLDNYHLFSNAEDPRSAPNSSDGDGDVAIHGTPFVLNTKLFSDYATKYRVLFMPAGAKAIYKDASTDGQNATIIFPVGTIIAKTFAFADETAGAENVVETRLLIKRVNPSNHAARWDGLAYIWGTENGRKVARYAPSGGHATVSWNYHDVDSGAPESGTTDYQIPNANQCLSCHSREDSEAGAAPIGLKIRNLNRAYKSESPIASGQADNAIKDNNQVEWLCTHGMMLGCPSDLGVNATSKIATKLERLPAFNKPGDSGATAGSGADIEARARAYLEVNCMHCHNVHGFAASTGLYLNASGPVGLPYGICKNPTATGAEGSGGRHFDIYPADASKSIVEFRIGDLATSPAARMPPLARTVVHAEGHDLVKEWINNVIVADESKYPNSTHCN